MCVCVCIYMYTPCELSLCANSGTMFCWRWHSRRRSGRRNKTCNAIGGRLVRLESTRFFEEPNRKEDTNRGEGKKKVSKGGCSWQYSCGIKGPRRALDLDVTTLHTLVTRYCEILLSRGSSCEHKGHRKRGKIESLRLLEHPVILISLSRQVLSCSGLFSPLLSCWCLKRTILMKN